MIINVYLYDQQGNSCNRQVPELRIDQSTQTTKLLRRNKTFASNRIGQLEIGDAILFQDQINSNLFDIGLIAFSDVRKSRMDCLSISNTLQDILLLNAPQGATVNIYSRNDFRVLANGLTLLNSIEYERDMLRSLDTTKYKIKLR